MTSKRYTEEFRAEASKQVTERGYPMAEVSQRLGVSSHSLYEWLRRSGVSRQARKTQHDADLERENQQLRAELRRVEEEREILKRAAAYFAKG